MVQYNGDLPRFYMIFGQIVDCIIKVSAMFFFSLFKLNRPILYFFFAIHVQVCMRVCHFFDASIWQGLNIQTKKKKKEKKCY